MTPADHDLHRLALAACIVAASHLDADEHQPCSRHLLWAVQQMGVAS